MAESERPTPHLPANPEPALDPEVEAEVRALLAGTQADRTGPMPLEVSERISRALDEETLLRVGRGPLTGAGGEPVRDMAGPDGPGAGVVALSRRRQSRPWVALAAVAAAAAVVAVGASALQLTKRPNPAAVVVADTGTRGATATPTTPTGTATPSAPHIQLSTTDYDATTLAAKARALLDDPTTPLHDLAAESPGLGPIATPVGLASCLDALAVGPGQVAVDLATFQGRPAAIIVVTEGPTSTAYAVGRSCSPGNVTALAGATPVP